MVAAFDVAPAPCCQNCGVPVDFNAIIEYAMTKAGLTKKEREVMRLVLKGMRDQEIGELLGNTTKNTKHHTTSIFRKFDVRSRAELFHAVFPS